MVHLVSWFSWYAFRLDGNKVFIFLNQNLCFGSLLESINLISVTYLPKLGQEMNMWNIHWESRNIPLVWYGHLRVGYTLPWYTDQSHTWHRLFLPFLRAEHMCWLTELRLLDFAKGAFFEADWGKNHALYLYLPELLICVKGITEVVFYFVFSFTVKEGLRRNDDLLRIDNFFTGWAFYLIFCFMVLPLQRSYNFVFLIPA